MTGPLRPGLVSALGNATADGPPLRVTLTIREQVAAVDAVLAALRRQGYTLTLPDPDTASCPVPCPLAGATGADPDDLPEHPGRVGQLTIWDAPNGHTHRPYATTYWVFGEGSGSSET